MDEAYFRQRYEADAANKAKQSWKEHHEWVHTFYHGKRFPPVAGWGQREHDILAKVPAASRQAVHERLAHVGRLLASEWAKDNAVRKVSTSDLQAWGKRFGDAAKDPAMLEAALAEVQAELAKRGVSP